MPEQLLQSQHSSLSNVAVPWYVGCALHCRSALAWVLWLWLWLWLWL